MARRIIAYLITIQLILLSCINICSADALENAKFSLEKAFDDIVVIDDKPAIRMKYINPNNSPDKYEIRLITDNEIVETLSVTNTDVEKVLFLEFAVKEEGYHKLRAELIKNGFIYDSYEFEQYYIKSVNNNAYTERGFCIHYAGKELDAKMLKAEGISVIRDDLWWNTVEQERGIYDFSTFDENVRVLTEYGLDIMFILNSHGMGNDLYLDEKGSAVIRTPEQIKAFTDFCLEAVKRYPNIKKWEILNEPNFIITGEEYFNIIYAVSKALKEYNPDLEIYVGALAQEDAEKFLNDFYKEELYPYIDGISDHYYSHHRYADNSDFYDQVDTVSEIVKNGGGWKQYAITETGYSSGTAYEQVPYIKQASENVKRAVLCDWYGIDLMTFYDFKNDGHYETEREYNFGVVGTDNTPKDSYYTIKKYQEATNKAKYVGKAYLNEELSSHVYVANDDCFMIVWAKNSNIDKNVTTENTATSVYTFAEDVVIEDMFGTRQPGNVLNATYQPMYVHGLSKDFCLNAIEASNNTERFDELETLMQKYGYSAEGIINAYDNIFNQKKAQNVKQYIDKCYDEAHLLVKSFLENNIEISEVAFSEMLSCIANVANDGASLILLMDDTIEMNDDLVGRYEALKTTPLEAVRLNVPYINEPYYLGKKLLLKNSQFDEGERVRQVNSDGFKIKSDKTMVVYGSAQIDEVLVRVENQSGETVYINLIPVDEKGYYYFTQKFDFPYDEYTVKVNNGEIFSTKFNYQNDDEYLSMEDKMTAINSHQADCLLKLYSSLLGWADVKWEYTNPDVKALAWNETNIINVTGNISRLAWAEYTDVILSVYDKETNELVKIDTVYPDINGDYRFTFRYEGDVDDIYVKVNQGGVIVDAVNVRQAEKSELIYGSFNLKEDADAVKVLLDIKNYFELTDKKVQVVIAYYDNTGKLISCQVEDIKDINKDGFINEYTVNNTDTSVSIKFFAWESMETLIPYTESLTIE